jgi:hypothetical protein
MPVAAKLSTKKIGHARADEWHGGRLTMPALFNSMPMPEVLEHERF